MYQTTTKDKISPTAFMNFVNLGIYSYIPYLVWIALWCYLRDPSNLAQARRQHFRSTVAPNGRIIGVHSLPIYIYTWFCCALFGFIHIKAAYVLCSHSMRVNVFVTCIFRESSMAFWKLYARKYHIIYRLRCLHQLDLQHGHIQVH